MTQRPRIANLQAWIEPLHWQVWPVYVDAYTVRYIHLGPLTIRWDTGR